MDQGLLLKFRSLKSEYLNNCDIQIKMEAIIKGMRNDLKKLKNGSRQQYSSLNEILVRKKKIEIEIEEWNLLTHNDNIRRNKEELLDIALQL